MNASLPACNFYKNKWTDNLFKHTCATRSSGTADAGMTGLVLNQLLPDLPRIAALTILPRTLMPPDGDAVEPAMVVDVLFAVAADVTVLGESHLLRF